MLDDILAQIGNSITWKCQLSGGPPSGHVQKKLLTAVNDLIYQLLHLPPMIQTRNERKNDLVVAHVCLAQLLQEGRLGS
jgi:hypothetical protein